MPEKCHKCGCDDKRLFHHHKSYEPEVIVMMCWSCHKKLHAKLRREGTCQVPVDELNLMSINSKHARKQKNVTSNNYHNETRMQFDFTETMMSNVELHEVIRYNYKKGTVIYTSRFRGRNGQKLLVINIEN